MVVPSYTEDLTDIATGDELAGWVEMTGTDQDALLYTKQGAPAYGDNEYPYIQGLYAVTQDCTKSAEIGSLGYSSGGITIPTDGAVFVWHNFSSPFAMGTYAQGGYRIFIGSGLLDFNIWYTGGSDTETNPYGGFVNHVVNPTVTRDNWAGTTTGTLDYVGSAVYVVSGPSKGEPHQVDAMRYGRGSAIFEFGESANYCTVAGFAALNDAQAARWGLLQETSGGYLWKGRISLGTATNAVDFRDSNQTIFLQWTPKVTINFNTIEILNASSNIEMTGFQFIVLDPTGTASRGRWITTNDATVALELCTFSDMYTFVFDSNTTIINCTFKRCNQVTQGGASFDSCNFEESDAAVSLVADSLNDVSDCNFISDGSNHALNLGTIAASASVNCNNFFTSYASSNGSTGNEAILVNVASGQTLTINVGSGYDTPFYYNTGTGVVSVVVSPVTTLITVKDNNGLDLQDARVYLVAEDGLGDLPFEDAVTSITRAGTLATVTTTAVHGMNSGESIKLAGITDKTEDNTGAHLITVTSTTVFTYPTTDSGSVDYTGTITATGVTLDDVTDVNGEISSSRTYNNNQNVTGSIRKSTDSPRFKSFSLAGKIVDSSNGLTVSVRMILDE